MEKTLLLDMSRCVGCGACVVACQDQNDLFPEQGMPAFRRMYQIEDGGPSGSVIHYLTVSCRHCEDSPCLIGCPTGAIFRDEQTGAVLVDQARCIGCHSCALACPFGVPRYDADDLMRKCTLCHGRVRESLKPACVKACPFGALTYGSANAAQGSKEKQYLGTVSSTVRQPQNQGS